MIQHAAKMGISSLIAVEYLSVENPKEVVAPAQLRRLQFLAIRRSLQLFVIGKIGLFWSGAAALNILLLVLFFKLAVPAAIVGGLLLTSCGIGWLISKMWFSQLCMVAQEEGCWEFADHLVENKAQPYLGQCMSGEYPTKPISLEADMALSQVQLLMIRKGEDRNALKLARYLYESNKENLEQTQVYGALLTCTGRFQEGITLIQQLVGKMEKNGRADSPVLNNSLTTLAKAMIDLHRFEEAQEYLTVLQNRVHKTTKKELSTADEVMRLQLCADELDLMFYYFYFGVYLIETGSAEADVLINSAKDLMSKPELQKKLNLMYPEILTALAKIDLLRGNDQEAHNHAAAAMEHYKERTRYSGPEFQKTKAMLAFVSCRLGRMDAVSDLEDALNALRAELEPNHPSIADCLTMLGQVYLLTERQDDARASLEAARKIYKALFPEKDPQIEKVDRFIEKALRGEEATTY
jgi:tetratricopeptide (TPR) repeat protein